MAHDSQDSGVREQRVNEAIAAYLEAADAGQAPDRQPFLARHADIAVELETFFANRDRFQRLAEPLAPTESPRRGAQKDLPAGATALAHGTSPDGCGLGTVRYFGDYELLEEIARGGMGVIYKARQVSLNRLVALKMILAGQFASLADVQRFRTEAEATANLDHPHIVPIYEVGEHEGQHYFSMKLTEGGSLTQKVAELGQHPRAAAQMLATVARAVHYAHQRGILHRDLKPANILLDDQGQPHVTDFGLAKRVEGDQGLTRSGAIVGTPSYMAPEQAWGQKHLTTAVDVYSLGATLYELLTGRPPFRAETPQETLLQVMEREPERPRTRRRRIDRNLETICLKCLEKQPERRYGSAEALAEDLERWLAGEPIQARRTSAWERTLKWARRRPAVAGLVVALFLVSVVAFFGITLSWRQAEASRRASETARREAESNLYASRVALAHQEWLTRDRDGSIHLSLVRANEVLDDCPAALRGWEWQYLKRRCEPILRTLHSHPMTLKDHRSPVQGLVISPNGRTVAILGGDNTVQMWQAKTGREIRTLHKYAGTILRMAFHPDGRRLVLGCVDKTVKVCDLETGAVRLTFRKHTGPVYSALFSPDGKHIASVADKTAMIWDAATGKVLHRFAGMDAVLFSPDGRRMALVAPETVKICEATSGKEIGTLMGVRWNWWLPLVFSPDGKQIASTVNPVKVWDTTTLKKVLDLTGHKAAPGPGRKVAFSPDGKRLATVITTWKNDKRPWEDLVESKITVWDIASGREAMVLAERLWASGKQQIRDVQFSPDGTRLVAAASHLVVWDAVTGRERGTFWELGGGYVRIEHDLSFSPDGQFLAVAGEDMNVRDGNPKTNRRVVLLILDGTIGRDGLSLHGHTLPATCVAFSPDGKRLASGSGDPADHNKPGQVIVWDPTTGRKFLTLRAHRSYVSSVAFSPDGQRLASAGHDRTVKVWDAATGKEIKNLRGHTAAVSSVAFSPDGRYLASGSHDKTVKLWQAKSWEKVSVFQCDKPISQITFSPDGQQLATINEGRQVQLWEVASGRDLTRDRLYRPLLQGTSMAFSPDGKRMAAATGTTVRAWDRATAQQIFRSEDKSNWIYKFMFQCVAFSPDGQRIAAGSVDNSVKIWDPATGKELLTLRGHANWVFSIAFSRNGKLASAGGDGIVRIWDGTRWDAKASTVTKLRRSSSSDGVTYSSLRWQPTPK